MISIKDYAKSQNVSYEAVRKQVNRYKKDLEGHIYKVGRTQHLDDKAVEFLDSKRMENPVVVIKTSKDEEIQRLSDENKTLLMKIAELQDLLLQEKDNVKLLQQEKIALLEEKKETQSPQPTEEKKRTSLWHIFKL